MKLSDVVSGAGLSSFAEIALVIFLGVFLAVALRALFSSRASMDRAARMPLDDESLEQPSDRGAE
jgi:cbb3-type cytochrome oxidase subunit 3